MGDNEVLLREFKSIVGDMYVVHSPEDLIVFEYDGSVDRALAAAVVLPSTTEEVSQVMKVASRYSMPIVARGAGTGLSGGAIAEHGGIVMALTRMTDIIEIDVVHLKIGQTPFTCRKQIIWFKVLHGNLCGDHRFRPPPL